MRTIKLILLTIILIVIVTLAVANRHTVTLHLLPEGLWGIARYSVELPHYVVGLALIVTGMVLGYILEWLREYKHRKRAAQKAREAEAAKREVQQLRKSTGRHEDDVLAIIGN